MTLDQIKENLLKVHSRKQTSSLLRNPDIMVILRPLYPDVADAEIAYMFKNNIPTRPVCLECSNPVKWLKTHYPSTCSTKCREQYKVTSGSIVISEARKKITMISKYGVDNASKNPESIKRRKETTFINHGDTISEKSRNAIMGRLDNFKTKAKSTIKLKYNVDNPSLIPNHGDKCKKTMMDHYGVDSVSRIPEILEKRATIRFNKIQSILPQSITMLNVLQPDKEKGEANQRIELGCTCGKNSLIPYETLKWRIANVSTPCSDCGGIYPKSSLMEKSLVAYISTIYDGTILENSRSIITPYELDIFLPEENIAIEFCGLYWHSELNGKDYTYHLNKFQKCADMGIKLITVFEDELVHNRPLVESRIRNLLKPSDLTIYGRKCIVRAIDPIEANRFLNLYHLQGSGRSNARYGIYFNEELMSVMTFSNNNISRKLSGWEINRFCTKSDVTIIGGASRLFKRFLTDIKPDSVISFADLRWGTGEVYGLL